MGDIVFPKPWTIIMSTIASCKAYGMTDYETADFLYEELSGIMSLNGYSIEHSDRYGLVFSKQGKDCGERSKDC